MAFGTLGARVLGLVAAVGLVAGVLASSTPSSAAVTCPTVNPSTGAVTPAPAPEVDWAGCDLAGADLAHANLSEAYLPGADLAGANLTGANLESTDLESSNLTSANLTSATVTDDAALQDSVLTGVNLDGTALSGSFLAGVTSGGITGTPASLPPDWSLVLGYLIGEDVNLTGANLTGSNLVGAVLLGANLTGANLTNVNLADADLGSAKLADTTLTGATLTGATMNLVSSGGITGTPAALPANWNLVDGYLVGPTASLGGASLAGADLAGADLADLAATDANLTDAELAGANLSRANLKDANLTGADFDDANLSYTILDGATVTGATWTGATWFNTICPDDTNSEQHVDGCFSAIDTAPTASPAVTTGTPGADGWYTSAVTVSWNWTGNGTIIPADCPATSSTGTGNGAISLSASCADEAGQVGHATYSVKVDTTQPVVSVTGVRSGARYLLGKVPAAGCQTTDTVSGVAARATVTVATTGHNGVGRFTATCAGAVSVASNRAAAKSVGYIVEYGFGGFTSPARGSTHSKSAAITVRFRLTNAAGQTIASRLASALAADHRVRATLSGPHIAAVTVFCRWNATARSFQCTIRTPAGIRTGRANRYSITAGENPGGGFATTPPVGTAVDPEGIYFS
jgi:uncharacterized protein YjbI with pentapeptide repeats